MINVLLILACLLSWTTTGWSAEIPHAVVTQTTEQSTTSASYVDITGASLASGNFVAGEVYFIHVVAAVAENSSIVACVRLRHGTTVFEGSENCSSRSSTVKEYYGYRFTTMWTAVGSEAVTLQFVSQDGVNTVFAHFIEIKVMRLSGFLTANVDYVFAERTTDDALSTTPTNGAACSITPATAGHDWAVWTVSNIDSTNGTTTMQSRIVRSGEASSSNPTAVFQPLATTAFYTMGLARVFNLGAAANTFTEESAAGGSVHTRLYSNCFILDLNKFAARASAYTDGATTLGTSEYGNQLESISITPTVAGDVWIDASLIGDKTASSGDVELRIQVDNSDSPSGVTAASINFDIADTTVTANDMPTAISTLLNLSAAAHTIDLDASSDASTAEDAKQRSIFAFTMELFVPVTGRNQAMGFVP